MRARYTGNAFGMWKGLDLAPGREFDIPEALQDMVARHPQFEVKRGKSKVRDDDAA
jgi:hypothetical protein